MMRVAALILVSALALAACGKNGQSGPGASANGSSGASQAGAANPGGVVGNLFPNLFQASYRTEANVTSHNGATTPVVMVRSGHNLRMEMDSRQGHITIIQNGDTHH